MRAQILIVPMLLSLLACKAEPARLELLLDDHRTIEFHHLSGSNPATDPDFPSHTLLWQAVDSNSKLHQGFYSGRLYIRLTLSDSQNGKYRIRFRNSNLENVEFLDPATGAVIHEGVRSRSRAVFPSFELDTDGGRSLLIRVDSRTPYRLPLEIIPESEWTNTERLSGIVPAFVGGATLTLLVYYFLLWRRTGDRSSLYFLPYLLFVSLHRLTYHGVLTPLLKPDNGHLQLPLALFFSLGATIILLLWTNHFLRPLIFGPAMRYLTQLSVIIAAALLVAVPFTPYLANQLTYLMALPYSVYLILLGFTAARMGYGPALYFGLSVLTFPVSIITTFLLTVGMSSIPPYVDFAVDASFLLQILLMAFAIVDGLRSEVQEAHDKLESEVRLRTAELREEVIERTRAQKSAEEANRAKTQFLANISHEIRTPMNVILGTNELLREQPDLKEDQRQLLAAMHQAGVSLLQILDDVLQTSRLELGQVNVNQQDFLLREWLDHLCAPFAMRMTSAGVSFQMQINDVPDRLIGDATSASQILGNLLSNAVKFTSQGSIKLIVSKAEERDGKVGIRFSVIDTGIGIPEEDHTHVFSPFSPASSRTAARYGGTGLGLSIAQSLTKLLGGTLTFESRLGSGSQFTLTLPFRRAPEKAATAPAAERFINARILLAEDQPENRFLFDRYLRKHVRELIFAEDGEQAVSTYSSTGFDLVLMDIRMPVMDGYEAYVRIREFESASGRHHTPVLALTAHAMDADQDRLRQTGFDEILTKPVRKTDLLDAIQRHVDVVRPF